MTPTSSEKKISQMLWIVGIAFGAMLGIGGTVTLSYGATKNQVETNTVDIQTLKRTSVDYLYLDDLIRSNLLIVDVLKAAPGSAEMDEALKAWHDFQLNTTRKMNPVRGGTSSPNSAE